MDPADLPAWKRSLPNALTLARVALAGVFFAVLAWWRLDRSPLATGAVADPYLLAAAMLFIAAAITDALDGHLARRWKVVSPFGRVMDPFADKVLVIGALVMLAGPGFWAREHTQVLPDGSLRVHGPFQVSGVLPWMAVIVLARELLVTSIRGVYESRGVDFSATFSGKLKMILQCIHIPAVLIALAVTPWREWENVRTVGRIAAVLAWVVVAITVWSGLPYIARAIKQSGRLAEKPA